MKENEAVEKLIAYNKCQRLQVKGTFENCNDELCLNCDLCYAQGTVKEHIKSIDIAIQALEKQIPKNRHMRAMDMLLTGRLFLTNGYVLAVKLGMNYIMMIMIIVLIVDRK